MINDRESSRGVPALGIHRLRQDEHEIPSRSRVNLKGGRSGGYSLDWSLSLLPARLEPSMTSREDLLQFNELSTDEGGTLTGIGIVKSDLKQFPVHEPGLQGGCIMTGQRALGRRDQKYFQSRLVRRGFHRLVQLHPHSPVDETVGRISPTETKWGLKRFGAHNRHTGTQQQDTQQQNSHLRTQSTAISSQLKSGPLNSRILARRGSVLIEALMALVILTVVGMVLLKGTLNILSPRQWTLVQNVSDAYLTYEKAYAQRIPFESMTGLSSPWPVYPAKAETTVTMGTLPGGRILSANVIRTRIADSNNLPAFGGTSTTSTNPAEMQTWKLQSHITYTISGRSYVKSRTIVRTQ
jgi:hypothetical protein